MAQSTYQLLNLTGNITLSWPFSFSGPPVVTDIIDVGIAQVQTPCYAATTSNLIATYYNGINNDGIGATLTNSGAFAAFSVDGLSPILNERILVTDQTLTFQNGIYTVTTVGDNVSIPWVLTRATDYNSEVDINVGDFVFVMYGTINTETTWVQTVTISTVGISPIIFMNQNGWAITLPNATLASTGQNIIFNNISTIPFRILLNDGLTLLTTITAGQVIEIYLYNNTTPLASNGLWRVIPFGSGTSAITAFVAESSDNTIVITNGGVTPPGGVIDFQLPGSLTNLNNVSTIGIPVILSTTPLTWGVVSLVPGSNIGISNGNGVNGNPTINLAGTITGLTSVAIGSLILTNGAITNSASNGNVTVTTNGTGQIQLNGVSIDINGNISGIANFVAPKAFCTFTDTITGDSNTIVPGDQVNVTSIMGSAGTYVINFTTPMSSTTYGVLFSLGSTGGSLPFVSNAYWIVRQTTSVTIIVTDASGELVLAIPNGITITIMSN